jgi:site-specific DNA recombinase
MKDHVQNGADHTRYAAIYARVSTEDQGKGFSIPTQLEACRKLAAHEGYAVPESDVLIDEGISGTTLDRLWLQKLRDLVTTKAITAIIVYDPDRLSRSLGHQLLLAEEMERAGVKLLIVSHPLEQGPEGWLFFQMRGAIAEYERAKILERLKRGLIGRAQAKHTSGGNVPLGYRYVAGHKTGRFELDEEEAALVRRIFQMCVSGMTTRAIAMQLSAERVPTQRERRGSKHPRRLPPGVWNLSSIHYILRNEAYLGRWHYNKRQRTPSAKDPHKRSTFRPRDKSEWIAVPIPAIIDSVLGGPAAVLAL